MASETIEKERRRREAALVEAFRDGDTDVQREWFASCRRAFARTASGYPEATPEDLDDIFQDSFLIMWEKIDSRQIFVECGEVVVATPSGTERLGSLTAYFLKVARNRYFLLMRSRCRIAGDLPADIPSDREIFDVIFWDEDPEVVRDRILSAKFRELPASCRELLREFYLEMKTLRQILEERGDGGSYDGLKTRKSKCLASLREKVSKAYADYLKK